MSFKERTGPCRKDLVDAMLETNMVNVDYSDRSVTVRDLLNIIGKRLKLSEESLRQLDYPRPHPNGKDGEVKFYVVDHHGFHEGCCKRCGEQFDVTFADKQQCYFHVKGLRKYEDGRQQHRSCGKPNGLKGCRNAPSHVHKGNMYLDVSGYRKTEERPEPADGDYGVYAIDTEYVHTIKGLELCKITVIDPKLEVVYDEYCIPASEIIDYNTIWSGVKASNLEGITKSYDDVRNDILELVSKDTILIGHGLNNDLISLKLLHDNIVDTVDLYPHDSGLPSRRSLKAIAKYALGKTIQTGVGHDSKEDAATTMQLALRKI